MAGRGVGYKDRGSFHWRFGSWPGLGAVWVSGSALGCARASGVAVVRDRVSFLWLQTVLETVLSLTRSLCLVSHVSCRSISRVDVPREVRYVLALDCRNSPLERVLSAAIHAVSVLDLTAVGPDSSPSSKILALVGVVLAWSGV